MDFILFLVQQNLEEDLQIDKLKDDLHLFKHWFDFYRWLSLWTLPNFEDSHKIFSEDDLDLKK